MFWTNRLKPVATPDRRVKNVRISDRREKWHSGRVAFASVRRLASNTKRVRVLLFEKRTADKARFTTPARLYRRVANVCRRILCSSGKWKKKKQTHSSGIDLFQNCTNGKKINNHNIIRIRLVSGVHTPGGGVRYGIRFEKRKKKTFNPILAHTHTPAHMPGADTKIWSRRRFGAARDVHPATTSRQTATALARRRDDDATRRQRRPTKPVWKTYFYPSRYDIIVLCVCMCV